MYIFTEKNESNQRKAFQMPRANRYYMPGYVWHITHRCHKQEFLLKFNRDKKRWIYWLNEAKNRFHLKILNYNVTSNHIHLLIVDHNKGAIARPSSQYINLLIFQLKIAI